MSLFYSFGGTLETSVKRYNRVVKRVERRYAKPADPVREAEAALRHKIAEWYLDACPKTDRALNKAIADLVRLAKGDI